MEDSEERAEQEGRERPPTTHLFAEHLHFSYASGLLSMGQAELLTMLVPLWALMQGAQPAEIGLLIGAKSALTFFLAIHGGALMDRLGTRRVMLFFAGATAVLAAAYPFLPWLARVIALQMLIGFAGNMNWIGAQTIIAQVTGGDPGQIGRFSFFARIGNVVAPILMGLLWDIAGPTISFLGVTFWCCFMFLAVSQIELPPAKTADRGPPSPSRRAAAPVRLHRRPRADRAPGGGVHAGDLVHAPRDQRGGEFVRHRLPARHRLCGHDDRDHVLGGRDPQRNRLAGVGPHGPADADPLAHGVPHDDLRRAAGGDAVSRRLVHRAGRRARSCAGVARASCSR